LLVAPKQPPSEAEYDGYDDYDEIYDEPRGYYEDGAYTALPSPFPEPPPSALSTYHASILARFETLHTHLLRRPPQAVLSSLDQNHEHHMATTADSYRRWRWRVSNTDPHPAQVAGMGKETVVRLLRLLARDKSAFGGNSKCKVTKRLGAWAWALLAKLPDRGELNSEEVGVVRELAKRAVWWGVEGRMGELEQQALREQAEEENDEDVVLDVEIDVNDDAEPSEDMAVSGAAKSTQPIIGPVLPQLNSTSEAGATLDASNTDGKADPPSDELAAARARLLANLEEGSDAAVAKTQEKAIHVVDDAARGIEVAVDDDVDDGERDEGEYEEEDEEDDEVDDIDATAQATLQMIITIAGEVYGQRDLLEFRDMME
jgi:hypothetical protein